jgi:hypothetical protein
MKSIEDLADADYGSRVLAAFRKKGLSTTQWNNATIQAMEKSSRLEFLELFKKHDRFASYAMIQVIRTATPEALVERLVNEKAAQDQMMAMIPIMFAGIIGIPGGERG